MVRFLHCSKILGVYYTYLGPSRYVFCTISVGDVSILPQMSILVTVRLIRIPYYPSQRTKQAAQTFLAQW